MRLCPYSVTAVAAILFPNPLLHADDDPLFVATPITESGEFTEGIEGPACDAAGNIFAVSYRNRSNIGRVTPAGKAEVFVTLPNNSAGNGIRFDSQGKMLVADYIHHNVLKIDPATREVTVLAQHDGMNQPNDLAIDANDILYASDPDWGDNTGQLWRIDPSGKVTRIAADLGTTNGIEVSPDGRTLYVNESVQRNLWAFTITATGVKNKRLIKKFDDYGFDGMRCDVDGNLYITRHGKGTVVKLTPMGEVLREINVLGEHPTNICFGGPDGRTAYVTEAKQQRLVSFRIDRPGAAWQRGHQR
jgi:gluconolactonase